MTDLKPGGLSVKLVQKYLHNRKEYKMEETVRESVENEESSVDVLIDPDMVSEERVEELKAKYPDNDIYAVPIAGEVWIYRDIRRPEYYKLKNDPIAAQPEAFEEMIVKLCVLYPESIDFEKGKAGVPAVLADLIFLSSGFEPAAPPVKL